MRGIKFSENNGPADQFSRNFGPSDQNFRRTKISVTVSFPDARETGHNTTETNLYDTEAKVNQQYGDKA